MGSSECVPRNRSERGYNCRRPGPQIKGELWNQHGNSNQQRLWRITGVTETVRMDLGRWGWREGLGKHSSCSAEDREALGEQRKETVVKKSPEEPLAWWLWGKKWCYLTTHLETQSKHCQTLPDLKNTSGQQGRSISESELTWAIIQMDHRRPCPAHPDIRRLASLNHD